MSLSNFQPIIQPMYVQAKNKQTTESVRELQREKHCTVPLCMYLFIYVFKKCKLEEEKVEQVKCAKISYRWWVDV